MIIDNVSVVVKIVGQNKKSYSSILNKELKTGEVVKIDQKQLSPRTRELVWCECDICGEAFTRKMIDNFTKRKNY